LSLAAALVTLLPLHPENSNTTENTIETRKLSLGECEHSHLLCYYRLLLNAGAHGQDVAWLAGAVWRIDSVMCWQASRWFARTGGIRAPKFQRHVI